MPRHARAANLGRTGAPRARRGWLRWTWGSLGLLVLVAVVSGILLARDAAVVRRELLAAGADVTSLQKQAGSGQTAQVAPTVADLQRHSAVAHRHTTGPVWAVAAVIPWVSDQVDAVRTVADVVDTLAQQTLPPLVDVVRVVNPGTLAPVDGRVDLEPLREAAPRVTAADDSVRAAQDQLGAIDTSRLVSQLAIPVSQLRDQVDHVAVTVGTAARAANLLPAMLGADGPREYLVLVQNNAELRATGGIPGSVLHLRAADGRVQVVDQWSGGELVVPKAALPLTDAETALFGPLLGTDMRDVTFTPDFPRSAALAAAIWQQRTGKPVDGVLSVDPGTLAQVLGATGPVTVPDGTQLTAQNAVDVLLNGVYLRFAKPAAQDAFFAATAAQVLAAAVEGKGSAVAVVDALAQSSRDGRLMLWSAHPEEQQRIAGTVLSGELAQQPDGTAVVGVYLNDGTQAKMGYYLALDVSGRTTSCAADGSRTVELTVALTSRAPADAAKLPDYITGAGSVVARGITRTNVMFYAPAGGRFDSIHAAGSSTGVFAQVHDGLTVAAATVDLTPGQTGTYVLRVTTAPHSNGLQVRTTPLAHGSAIRTLSSVCTH